MARMGPLNLKCYVTQPRPFQGRFVAHMLGLATTDLCTKFEISMLTHYKDMKGDEKCKKWVVWGLGVIQGHQQHSHSIQHIRLPIRL